MKKIYLIFFLVFLLFIASFYFIKLNEEVIIKVKLYPKNITIYPFEEANLSVYVNTSKPINYLIVTLEEKNSSLASILFPSVKNSANTSILLSLNESTTIKAIPDSVYLHNAKRISDFAFVEILKPNMSFFQLPKYKKLEVINLNSKGMRAIYYLIRLPISTLWPYINFSHIENAETYQNKSFTNIYIQSTLSTKQIADFLSFVYKTNYSKIGSLYFFNSTNSSICVTPKQGFTRIIITQNDDCRNFVNISSSKPLVNNLNLSILNITSPYIGEITNSNGLQAKGFSYQYGYYFIVKYPNKINCTYPFYFENKNFCINTMLQSASGYQYKILNITHENFGFYFLNFNVSVENQIQQFAFTNLIKLTTTTPQFP